MKSLVISPHPDDEVLGAGGTLFKRKKSRKSNLLYWIIVTKLKASTPKKIILKRSREIKKISKFFGFKKVFQLNFITTELDSSSKKKLIANFSDIFNEIKPNELFVPHFSDVHSDHKIVAEVISTCTKNFRFPFIKKILAYEVISETDFNLNRRQIFSPNYYEDISKFLTKKKNAMKIYKSEIKNFPFPRSIKTIDALAKLRGSQIGKNAAESFEILREIN
jgi:LmbE family N-acetylglucosaminyl deacetylase